MQIFTSLWWLAHLEQGEFDLIGPGSTTDYYYAVSSNSQLNSQLDQTYTAGATNADVRLEPVTSVTRVVEDHIGFQGYTSYTDAFGNPNIVAPAETVTLCQLAIIL